MSRIFGEVLVDWAVVSQVSRLREENVSSTKIVPHHEVSCPIRSEPVGAKHYRSSPEG